MKNPASQPDHGGDAVGSQGGFAHLALVADDDSEASLGARVDTTDVVGAAERGDVSAGFACGVRIAQARLDARG